MGQKGLGSCPGWEGRSRGWGGRAGRRCRVPWGRAAAAKGKGIKVEPPEPLQAVRWAEVQIITII